MNTYFYRDNSGKEIGPLDLDALVKLRAVGVLNDNTLARSESSTEWKILRELLPASPVAQMRQQSSKKNFNWTWVGLAIAAVIIFVAARSKVEHAAEAEKCFREISGRRVNGFKVVNFKAISGESSFIEKYHLGTLQRVECYKIKFTARLEFENDRGLGQFSNTIVAHKGDWEEISSTMIGEKGENGWDFGISSDSRDVDIINASNPSLLSSLKDARNANVRKAEAISQANQCINNLRQLDAAANQFALENKKMTGSYINFPSDLTPYIKLTADGKIPGCPMGGIYNISRVGDTPSCSLGNAVTPNHILP